MSNLLKGSAVALVAALLALGLAEVLVRLLAPQQLIHLQGEEIWRPDERLGWRVRENLDTLVNTGENTVRFTTDHRGRRVHPGGTAESDTADLRILVVGDSFVEALSVDYESSIARRLQQYLSARMPQPVAVTALAASGWNPYQYDLAVHEELENGRYDLGIVFLYAGNDVLDGAVRGVRKAQIGSQSRFRLPRRWSTKEWVDTVFYPLNDLLERKSHLFLLAKGRMHAVLARIGLTAAYFPDVFRKSFETAPAWRDTAEHCRRIQQEFIRHRAALVFVLIPCSYQVHWELFESYLQAFHIDERSVDIEQPNRLLALHFARASLPLVDPLKKMRLEALRGVRLFGRSDRHLNAAGHEVLSRVVGESVVNLWRQFRHAPATQTSAE